MLDKLPTELVLTLAELGAPQIAPDRKSLAIVRRRYFVSLAAVSRALYGALRPHIWEHVQIKGDEVDALVQVFTRDPRSAEFVKELVCADFSQPAFAKLWTLFPRFDKLTSLAICGLVDDSEPLQLCMLERLPALKYLHLRNALMSKRLPKIERLESLCLDGRVRVHRPLGQDVPIMPDAIITRHSTASKKTLRLVDHSLTQWFEAGGDEQYCLDALGRVDIVECDITSYASALLALPLRSSPSIPCFTLKTSTGLLDYLLESAFAPMLPADLHVRLTNPWQAYCGAFSEFRSTVDALCAALTQGFCRSLRLTLPTELGCSVAHRHMTCDRPAVYEILKQLRRCNIPISFYKEPCAKDSLTENAEFALEPLDQLGVEQDGYFTELLEGRCSDPELRDFKVVMVD